MDSQRSVSASVSAQSVVPQLKDFVLTEKLGSGTYATVYKAFKKVLMTTKSIGSRCRLMCTDRRYLLVSPALQNNTVVRREGGSQHWFMTHCTMYQW